MQKLFRWPTLIVLAVFLLAAFIPTIISINHATHARASGKATITLSAPTGQPGTTIAVSGQGFAASTAVSLSLQDANGTANTVLGTATTDGSGNLPSTTVTIPDQHGGSYDVEASAQGSLVASTTFTIEPEFTLSSTVLYPGETVTLNGEGFDYEVSFYLDSTTSYFYSLPSNSNGDLISQTLKLPGSNVLQGAHTIIAQASYYGVTLSAQLPVTLLPHVMPLYGRPGLNTQLTGAAFTAGEQDNIYWGGSKGQLLGTSTTDANGNLSFSLAVPSGLTDGSYPVTVVRPATAKPRFITTNLHINPVTMVSTPGIHIGQSVTVKLTGFLPNEQIVMSWNANGGQSLDWIYANQSGNAQATFSVPSAPVGSYTLTAKDSNGLQVSNSLNIGPGINTYRGVPGGTITVYGGGFSANETVNVYFGTTKATPVPATTDATGAFSVLMTLPYMYNPSRQYFIYAINASGSEHVRTPFFFLTPAFGACGYSCSEVYYGQELYFSGNNFGYNEIVDVVWNYQQPGQFIIASGLESFDGFTANATVPSTPNQSTVVVAAIGRQSHIVLTTTLIVDAAISASANNGSVGTSITIHGGSFDAGDAITLSLSGKNVATTAAGSDGTFSTAFKVPSIKGPGNLTLMATDTVTNTSATIPFYYIPVLTVSPAIVQNGDTITVTGTHFCANSSVTLNFPSGFQPYTYVSTNANGSFTASFLISGYSSGTQFAQAIDFISGLGVSAAFVVQ